ncbi:receptor tyrosine-protein kinase erbB-4-like [Platysternon megacephalum]|uniref:Receptor tyrosine-protein kinase erbB-4-like n=1 Tax=Platysternon megacephalum TaxID=55544 RepID=A0A4D9F774_9SAUR|nr:receptor tyrosine-protein kinase erbB-4-like [Platysternon megacephalum]
MCTSVAFEDSSGPDITIKLNHHVERNSNQTPANYAKPQIVGGSQTVRLSCRWFLPLYAVAFEPFLCPQDYHCSLSNLSKPHSECSCCLVSLAEHDNGNDSKNTRPPRYNISSS